MNKVKALIIYVVILCGFSHAAQPSDIGIAGRPVSITRFHDVLLIPDWNTDSVYMFDPYDATPLGGLCKVPGSGSPKNAIQGPHDYIYVSDQLLDAVYMYDTLGNFIGIYADASDGLDNVRGIDVRDNHLFVCCYPTTGTRAVKEFSAPHTFVRNFITYTNIDPFDILFLPDGRSLFADAGTSDKIALHDTNGAYIRTVYGRSGLWPQQIQFDSQLPGEFLGALWDADTIIDFDLDGTIVHTCTLKYVKGVYRLGNGKLLATSNYGMYTFNTTTGEVTQLNSNTGWQYIESYSVSVGASESYDIIRKAIQTTSVYPNPFSSYTRIRIPNSVSADNESELKIYNVAGKLVKTFNLAMVSGSQLTSDGIIWDGKDNNGLKVPNGIYIVNLKTLNRTEQYQVILIR
jgi:hypothetical protein